MTKKTIEELSDYMRPALLAAKATAENTERVFKREYKGEVLTDTEGYRRGQLDILDEALHEFSLDAMYTEHRLQSGEEICWYFIGWYSHEKRNLVFRAANKDMRRFLKTKTSAEGTLYAEAARIGQDEAVDLILNLLRNYLKYC